MGAIPILILVCFGLLIIAGAIADWRDWHK